MKTSIIVILFAFFDFSSCSALIGNGLKKVDIKIDDHTLRVEVVATEKDRNRGLMYRTSLDQNAGMLFIWSNTEYRNFWMKNTLIPLDIAFFDEQRFLINIESMQPDEGNGNYGDYRSAEPAHYAIEVNQGWFKKHGIKKYAKLTLPPGLSSLD